VDDTVLVVGGAVDVTVVADVVVEVTVDVVVTADVVVTVVAVVVVSVVNARLLRVPRESKTGYKVRDVFCTIRTKVEEKEVEFRHS